MLRRVNKMQPSRSNWNFPDFPPVPLSKPELLKLTIIMKIEMYYHTRRQRCQLYLPPYIAGRSSRSWHGVTTYVKPPGFKQLNWRIRENLSQAINNGSWYKLSLLVSEDAMIVPATCIYSVWRFTQNSWDMSPWNKHHYFRFYKLDVSKVINKLILSCTPLTTVILFQSRISFWGDC